MIIPVVRKVLEKNDQAARQNRALFDSRKITCVNVLGGAGCGKTTLLERVLPHVLARGDVHPAVLEGDIATTRDAERIAALNVPTVQLLTDGGCHLNANHVQKALDSLDLTTVNLLVIENVGNPVCPANFDLGEHLRVSCLSIAEGDDKPAKYPLLFRNADLIILTKADLLPHVPYDLGRVKRDLRQIAPGATIVQSDLSAGGGYAEIAAWLVDKVEAEAMAPASTK